MSDPGPILIAGGYGVVGGHLAELLAPRYPGRLVITGRDRDRAATAAAALANGCLADHLDAADAESVQAVIRSHRPTLVISCAGRTEPALAHACLTGGVHYIDVSADAPGITAVEQFHTLAVQSAATAVLSVGVAPGLTNLLALEVVSGLDHVERLDVGVQLSIGDTHGAAAIDWTLANMGAPFPVASDRRKGAVPYERPFAAQHRLDFGGPARVRAGGFNFPEQRTLARTLNVPDVRSWLALRPRIVHAVAAFTVRTGLARALSSPAVRAVLASAMGEPIPHGGDSFAVCAEASGTRDGQPQRISMWFAGRGEAAMTAEVSARVARLVLESRQSPGVWHIEQLPAAQRLLNDITRRVG
ncbi:MAG: saccharopine dehydrogenase NADP-binding domain-containing protein [Mycolicibacterium neoaurum]|uniref:saccharopine dehydrogenase family protein n=1 Tax=Mycolicibacterium neoaurum TaxID=1795 RepID=UPI002FF4A778